MASTPSSAPLRRAAPIPKLGDPAERGSLTVADRVVERVADHAVTRVALRSTGELQQPVTAAITGRLEQPGLGGILRPRVTIKKESSW